MGKATLPAAGAGGVLPARGLRRLHRVEAGQHAPMPGRVEGKGGLPGGKGERGGRQELLGQRVPGRGLMGGGGGWVGRVRAEQ